jgi:hypothetical protein
MSFYACDLGTRYPGTKLPEVLESARLSPEEAKLWAADALESDRSLKDQVSFEELETLLTEAGERSLNLANLVRGEVDSLMLSKKEISIEFSYGKRGRSFWEVTLPSGTISFVEMEDFCVCISEAKFTSAEEEDVDDSYFG